MRSGNVYRSGGSPVYTRWQFGITLLALLKDEIKMMRVSTPSPDYYRVNVHTIWENLAYEMS